MKKIKIINFVKHSLRIIISAILSIIVIKFYEFETFLNVLLFLGIYLVVSLILEFIFKRFNN